MRAIAIYNFNEESSVTTTVINDMLTQYFSSVVTTKIKNQIYNIIWRIDTPMLFYCFCHNQVFLFQNTINGMVDNTN